MKYEDWIRYEKRRLKKISGKVKSSILKKPAKKTGFQKVIAQPKSNELLPTPNSDQYVERGKSGSPG